MKKQYYLTVCVFKRVNEFSFDDVLIAHNIGEIEFDTIGEVVKYCDKHGVIFG